MHREITNRFVENSGKPGNWEEEVDSVKRTSSTANNCHLMSPSSFASLNVISYVVKRTFNLNFLLEGPNS